MLKSPKKIPKPPSSFAIQDEDRQIFSDSFYYSNNNQTKENEEKDKENPQKTL